MFNGANIMFMGDFNVILQNVSFFDRTNRLTCLLFNAQDDIEIRISLFNQVLAIQFSLQKSA